MASWTTSARSPTSCPVLLGGRRDVEGEQEAKSVYGRADLAASPQKRPEHCIRTAEASGLITASSTLKILVCRKKQSKGVPRNYPDHRQQASFHPWFSVAREAA